MTGHITTSYVYRVCDVPPLVARTGLTEYVRRSQVIGTPDWTLRFDLADAASMSGLLSAGWALRASVVLEIDSWSRDRALIGLRHRARAVPWWSAAYFEAAHDAVALIVAAVEAWADQPLRAVVEHDWGLARQ